MIRAMLALLLLAALSACATPGRPVGDAAPTRVRIVALNDFHGALEPPKATVTATTAAGRQVKVPAGGAAYVASAVARLKAGHPDTIVVSAGDLTSASPFASSQFLDEPSVLAMNLIGLDLNAVGNHEFDRGPDELKRLQGGGCTKYARREPCRVDRVFPGARYRYLSANVRTADGGTLFPATALRRFGTGRGAVRVGFIGLTLKTTPTLVVPSAVASLTFEDEADTINALVPRLRAEGADAIVVLIHQGLATKVGYDDKSCGGVSGDLLPILARLDPAVDVVVSGHTHNAYICDYGTVDPTRPMLVTSAGKNGMILTDIELGIDAARRRVVAKRADNLIVQSEPFQSATGPIAIEPSFPAYPAEPRVAALVSRYVAAAKPIAERMVGRLAGPALRAPTAAGETVLGDLVADAQLDATKADIALMNGYGLRADLVPAADGAVTYGQLYAVTPFANALQIKGMTGAQIRAVLEQQFNSGGNTVAKPNMLMVSRDFAYRYDLRRPAGQRVFDLTLNGQPVVDDKTYRVSISNFLASGGDNFTMFTQGTDLPGGGEDIDAFEAYFAGKGVLPLPVANRITRVDLP